MRVHIDRFENSGWAVLLLCPDGKPSCDEPRRFMPAGASPKGVFEVRFEHGQAETEWLANKNRWLPGELLGRDEG